MERIQILISKLKDQAELNASPSQMLVTVQMLQNELYQLQASGNHTLGTSKVAVMLPKTVNISVPQPIAERSSTKAADYSVAVEEDNSFQVNKNSSRKRESSSV